VQKTVAKFRSFAEAEQADREFCRRLFRAMSAWPFCSNYCGTMISSDLKEFIAFLNSHRVEIVGAHCVAFHARPRYTGDLAFFSAQRR